MLRVIIVLLALAAGPGEAMPSQQGRLRVPLPATLPEGELPPGTAPLGLGGGRDGRLRVPAACSPARPAPLLVLLHGAGGEARQMLDLAQALAEELGVVLVVPESRGRTWDVILGGYGPDVRRIERALEHVLARVAVDRTRVGIGGFSDGASYALSLGLGNGDLFTHVLAFSPGFAAPADLVGRPRLFVSHGVQDRVLPIDRTSRALVPRLEAAGYALTYREFPDGHLVPPPLAREAMEAFAHGAP